MLLPVEGGGVYPVSLSTPVVSATKNSLLHNTQLTMKISRAFTGVDEKRLDCFSIGCCAQWVWEVVFIPFTWGAGLEVFCSQHGRLPSSLSLPVLSCTAGLYLWFLPPAPCIFPVTCAWCGAQRGAAVWFPGLATRGLYCSHLTPGLTSVSVCQRSVARGVAAHTGGGRGAQAGQAGEMCVPAASPPASPRHYNV